MLPLAGFVIVTAQFVSPTANGKDVSGPTTVRLDLLTQPSNKGIHSAVEYLRIGITYLVRVEGTYNLISGTDFPAPIVEIAEKCKLQLGQIFVNRLAFNPNSAGPSV